MSKYYDNGGWEKVGTIGVDAGLCWIGDPCYVFFKTPEEMQDDGLGECWADFENKKETFCGKLSETELFTAFATTGIAVSTGYGDGEYNVYIKRDPKTNRVAAVKVVFIGDEGPDDYDENND